MCSLIGLKRTLFTNIFSEALKGQPVLGFKALGSSVSGSFRDLVSLDFWV